MPRTAVTVSTPYNTSRTYRASQARQMAARQKRANMLMAARSKYRTPISSRGFFGPSLRSRQEKKAVDVDPANYVADTTGSVTLLNGIATGTDFTDRIGRKVALKSLFIRGRICNIDNNIGPTVARLIVVYDMQTNGAAPSVTDILKSATSQAQLNLNNRDRFKVIVDKQWGLGQIVDTATQTYAAGQDTYPIRIFRKLPNLDQQFQGTTAAVGSIATGALWMVTIGDQPANGGGQFGVSTRVRFTDS